MRLPQIGTRESLIYISDTSYDNTKEGRRAILNFYKKKGYDIKLLKRGTVGTGRVYELQKIDSSR